MKEENKKNDGPTCACGRVDIYEEMLKNEKAKKETAEKPTSNQTKKSTNSTDTL